MDSNVVIMSEEDGLLTLSGPGTFSYKSKYRALGFRWRSDIKKWVHPDTSEIMKGQLRLLMAEDLLESNVTNQSRISYNQQEPPSRISYETKRKSNHNTNPKGKPIQKGDANQPSIHIIFDGEDSVSPKKDFKPVKPREIPEQKYTRPLQQRPQQKPEKRYEESNYNQERRRQQQRQQPQQITFNGNNNSFDESEAPIVFSDYGGVDLEVYNPNDYFYY